MAGWRRSGWIYLILCVVVSSGSAKGPSYAVHLQELRFDEALRDCAPGVLASLTSPQEADGVLAKISAAFSGSEQRSFTFWVGLKTARHECVVPDLPLKGFKWVRDGSQGAQFIKWSVEPQPTCIVRCAALVGNINGSAVEQWGLISTTCKTRFPFICRQGAEQQQRLELLEAEVLTTAPPPELTTRGGAGPDGPDTPDVLSSDCLRTSIPGGRSLSPDPTGGDRITVQCWSGVLLNLRCSGRPAVWRRGDRPVDPTTVCQPCRDGYQRDESGLCTDVDECRGTPCGHTCLNTAGSYRCVCYDRHGHERNDASPACLNGSHLGPGSPTETPLAPRGPSPTEAGHPHSPAGGGGALSGILIPLLVSLLLLLLLLLVVVAVVVKCCLRRRRRRPDAHKDQSQESGSKESCDMTEQREET